MKISKREEGSIIIGYSFFVHYHSKFQQSKRRVSVNEVFSTVSVILILQVVKKIVRILYYFCMLPLVLVIYRTSIIFHIGREFTNGRKTRNQLFCIIHVNFSISVRFYLGYLFIIML